MAKRKQAQVEAKAEQVSEILDQAEAKQEDAPSPVKTSTAVKTEPAGEKLITLQVPVRCKINGQVYYGTVKVTEKVAQVLIPMVSRKQKSDLKVFTGKNFNVSRLVDNSLVVKEG